MKLFNVVYARRMVVQHSAAHNCWTTICTFTMDDKDRSNIERGLKVDYTWSITRSLSRHPSIRLATQVQPVSPSAFRLPSNKDENGDGIKIGFG